MWQTHFEDLFGEEKKNLKNQHISRMFLMADCMSDFHFQHKSIEEHGQGSLLDSAYFLTLGSDDLGLPP